MLGLLEARAAEQPDVSLSMDFALVYEGLGDLDHVFEYYDKAADARSGAMAFLAAGSWWQGPEVRKDPRFCALLDRIGYPREGVAA